MVKDKSVGKRMDVVCPLFKSFEEIKEIYSRR